MQQVKIYFHEEIMSILLKEENSFASVCSDIAMHAKLDRFV